MKLAYAQLMPEPYEPKYVLTVEHGHWTDEQLGIESANRWHLKVARSPCRSIRDNFDSLLATVSPIPAESTHLSFPDKLTLRCPSS